MCIENCLNIRHVQDVPKMGGTTFKSEKVGRGLQLRKRTPSPLDRFPASTLLCNISVIWVVISSSLATN